MFAKQKGRKRESEKRRDEPTHLDQLRLRQSSLLQTRIQKRNMITQHLIHRLHLPQLLLQLPPIRLQHLARHERQHLLHIRHHLRSQRKHPRLPGFKFGRGGSSPPFRAGVIRPHPRKLKFGVFELEEESEENLISSDGFSRDDEGDGELDGVVELEGFVGCGWRERSQRKILRRVRVRESKQTLSQKEERTTHRSNPSSSPQLSHSSHSHPSLLLHHLFPR